MLTLPPNYKKDVVFVFRALVYALLLLALIHTFAPKGPSAQFEVNALEVEALSTKANIISAESIEPLIKQAKTPTVVMVYASWCGYCKKIMPSIIEQQQTKRSQPVTFVFISVDRKLSDLSEYIIGHGYQKNITPLYVAKDNPEPALQAMGATFTGAIPYIGFFDNTGTLQKEYSGMASVSEIKEAIAAIMPDTAPRR